MTRHIPAFVVPSGSITVNHKAPDGGGNIQLSGSDLNLSSSIESVFRYGPDSTVSDGTYKQTNGTARTIGDGNGTQLSLVYATLGDAQARYPFATALTQTVDACAVQLAINTICAQLKPPGGRITFGHGLYKFRDFLFSLPGPPGDNAMTFQGANGTIHQVSLGATTKFEWDNDVAGVPHFTFAIDATGCQNFTLDGISMIGPIVFPFTGGGHANIPCVMAGLRVQGQSFIKNCSFESFSTGIGYGGGTLGGFPVNHGFDHSQIDGLFSNGCAYTINLLPGSTSAGDQHWLRVADVDANCAVLAVATSGSSGFVGSSVTGGGWYSPVGQYLYDDFAITGTHGGAQILGNQYNTVSHEQCYNGSVVCQRTTNPGAGVFAKNSMTYFFQTPHPTLTGWGWNNAVITAWNGTNQITFTDGNGANWQAGDVMEVLDNTNPGKVPANTTVTSIAGSWPYAAPTMTLSNNLTGDPTGDTFTIRIKKRGHINAFTIRDNFAATYASGASFPAYWVPSTGTINNNVCMGITEPLLHAQSTYLTSGPSYNNTWGSPGGNCIASGILAAGVTCLANDLLMYDTGGQKLVLADGTKPHVGTAVLAQPTAGGNVDYYKRGSYPNLASVNVKQAVTLNAGAPIKADGANPGGVIQATGPNDGYQVGVNDASAIVGPASGNIAHLMSY